MKNFTDMHGRQRIGDWIQTYSGKQFFPLDPRQEDILLLDIAAALSKLTRYSGHCLRFFSVAEHSVLMARKLADSGHPAEISRTALLHDGSEAYLVDVPRPIKPALAEYAGIEEQLMVVIANRFRFEWPMAKVVKSADTLILRDEMMQNMSAPPVPWHQLLEGDRLGVTLQYWTPDQAFVEFMRAAQEFGAS